MNINDCIAILRARGIEVEPDGLPENDSWLLFYPGDRSPDIFGTQSLIEWVKAHWLPTSEM